MATIGQVNLLFSLVSNVFFDKISAMNVTNPNPLIIHLRKSDIKQRQKN